MMEDFFEKINFQDHTLHQVCETYITLNLCIGKSIKLNEISFTELIIINDASYLPIPLDTITHSTIQYLHPQHINK